MLDLYNVKKVYKVGSEKINALKGINLNFRKCEFVSILGQSGCGKTTLLNIIGGIDKYTTGELIINNQSTKSFKSKDWDSYRNHSIGFVFQSYNLIMHQSVLSNVELALTIAGISKKERTKRAKEVLEKVGLKDKYNKRPNQLSGGQQQRVAIARALVNNPDIILADEPTGALDSNTSVQIMDLIKEIAKEKLVIMVTHNPDLAHDYSTRIIELKDGIVEHDTNPFIKEKTIEVKSNRIKRTKMSFLTSFKLSLNNLISKKRRTILTALSGAIGIIGITTVLSVGRGADIFLMDMQDNMIAGSPLIIEENVGDLTDMLEDMLPFAVSNQIPSKDNFRNLHNQTRDILSNISRFNHSNNTNEITDELISFLNQLSYDYNVTLTLDYGVDLTNNLFSKFTMSKGTNYYDMMSLTAIANIYAEIFNNIAYSNPELATTVNFLFRTLNTPFHQLHSNNEIIERQYRIIEGHMPKYKHEIVAVLDESGRISDLTLAQMGILTQEEFISRFKYALNQDEDIMSSLSTSYESICFDRILNHRFKLVTNNDEIFYRTPEAFRFPGDLPPGLPLPDDFDDILSLISPYVEVPFIYNPILNNRMNKEYILELEVVGIIKPHEEVIFSSLQEGFFHTDKLTKYFIERNQNSEIVNYVNEANFEYFSTYRPGIQPFRGQMILGLAHLNNEVAGNINTLVNVGNIRGDFTSSLTNNQLGGSDEINRITIFTYTFECRQATLEHIDLWNSEEILWLYDGEGVLDYLHPNDRTTIEVVDVLDFIFTMAFSLVNIAGLTLIAFISLSLIVSSIMIFINTYISIVERTKEIGIIRAVGSRKKDVSRLFLSEAFITGLLSGLIGVFVSYIISIILNVIIYSIIGFNIVLLDVNIIIAMIALSIIIGLLSSYIPSRTASKNDPAISLRI